MRTVALWQSDVGNPADVRDRCVDVGLGLLCFSFVSAGDLLSENSEPPGGLVVWCEATRSTDRSVTLLSWRAVASWAW